jgi:hypothetical protein
MDGHPAAVSEFPVQISRIQPMIPSYSFQRLAILPMSQNILDPGIVSS